MKDRFDYGLDPEKCEVVSSYLCDPATAHLEFMLTKSQYQAETGRMAESGNLFFQIRQAFPEGEVTPEEANKIGHETVMRWTKEKYQFFVCTHTDRGHIHNHIYYCSTAFDRSRKFHNFWGSAFAVRRLSDRVCLEHGLSIIKNPKQHSKGQYKHYGEWLGDKPLSFQQRLKAQIDICLAEKPQSMDAFLQAMAAAGYEHKYGRGGVLSFRIEGQKNYTRLRSSTLGEGYGQEDIQAIVEGLAPLPAGRGRAGQSLSAGASPQGTPRRVNLIIDIQERMKTGKGPAYERWAKIYNLKMMAVALQYLQENNLLEYGQLEKKANELTDCFHTLSDKIKTVETAMSRNAELKGAMVDYAKTRPIFEGYKAARYSKKYLAEHEADIQIHRAAKETFTRVLDGGKLPRMDSLKAESQRLAADKKSLYSQYRDAQKDMREVVVAKSNIDHLLGLTGPEKNKEMTR